MQEAQVSGVQLLKPGEDPVIVLDLVDEAFQQMTLPVQMPVMQEWGDFLTETMEPVVPDTLDGR